MELLHVIIKSGPSPRPLAWSLDVSPSEEGDDWRMIRAFGDKDHCRKLWDLRPERRRRKARAAKRTSRADKPACSTQFASPRPLENGEMHVGVGEGVVARRVRVSFRAAHASPAKQQYYTVRALTVAARVQSVNVSTAPVELTAIGAAPEGPGLLINPVMMERRKLSVPVGSVVCSCLPGFTGPLCDSCEEATAEFPNCQTPVTPTCKCNPRGIVDPERVCDEVCECKVILPLGEAWLITDFQGNETLEPSVDEQGKPFVISYEVEGWEYFYWLTNSFNGDQLAAYGGEVLASVYWGIVRGDTGGNPTFGPDVILIGTGKLKLYRLLVFVNTCYIYFADGTMLAYSNTSHEAPGNLQISVPLLEGNWRVVEDDQLASRTQLMDVLRDMKGIMLKAHYHFDQDEVILVMCKCDSCDFGYWGSPTTPGGRCQACECGGSPCHPATGRCLTCPPHTEGARCDLCKEGYWFGEEGVGPSSAGCVQCACGAGALSGACDARTGHCACRAGWTGRACDTCVSAGCPVCRCGTAALNATCDAVSGECACAPGAAPPSCDTCLDEHYGLDSTGCKGKCMQLCHSCLSL
ncbi:hypothetical protein HF086_007160 [Spodoptera exigua]|uniref:Uncharacterized protein n=1 Tax=Spodoptera exigua TaxID=7107 RepID=A0A922MGT6_SPOEX|nr:hypothetical protein HF086_007160 [Spodoptera exigua]